MEINYDRLILGRPIDLGGKAKLIIPTINDLLENGQDDLMAYSRIFTTTVREQFSGVPEKVDEVEEKYPTFWEIAHDQDMSASVGEAMFGEGIDILQMIVAGFAYWTGTEINEYQVMTNGKIVHEKNDFVIDKQEFIDMSNLVTMVTGITPNEDLIAPKGISSKPNQQKIWKQLYSGRVRELKKTKSQNLADKILILEALSRSFIPFDEVGKMNYYQFTNLLRSTEIMRANEQNFAIYTSYKFDTKDMKLTGLSDGIRTTRLNN